MYEFTDQEFMTAGEKKSVLRDWERFLKALTTSYDQEFTDNYGNTLPLPFKAFSKGLYNHLIQHCSFIAHYDRYTFYQEYFQDPGATLKFMTQFDPAGPQESIEYGGSWWKNQYGDINRAMIEVAGGYTRQLRIRLGAKDRADDLAQAATLLRKHGVVPPQGLI